MRHAALRCRPPPPLPHPVLTLRCPPLAEAHYSCDMRSKKPLIKAAAVQYCIDTAPREADDDFYAVLTTPLPPQLCRPVW